MLDRTVWSFRVAPLGSGDNVPTGVDIHAGGVQADGTQIR
jgi:hypothetical protein